MNVGITYKQLIINAIEGRRNTSNMQIPFAPRMDLWYIANRQRGALPESLRNLDMPRLAEAFEFGCHALKADLSLPRGVEDFIMLGFGLENHVHFPFRFTWEDLDIEFSEANGQFRTIVHTPRGNLVAEMEYTDDMSSNGISMPFISRFPLRSAADIDSLCSAFEHVRVIACPEHYRRFKSHVGENGLPVASGMPAASPMHLILHNLASIETFFFMYNDEYALMRKLAETLESVYEAVLDAVLDSGSEIFYWGSNYDRNITYPGFFEKEIAPWLSHAAGKAHSRKKMLLTHADGDNGPLLDLYAACGVDVLESVCTEPMIPISMRELRSAVSGQCALWGGIPSVALLKNHFPDEMFDAFLDAFFEQLDAGERCVVGVSDNVPPDADLDRLLRIRDRCRLG